MEPWIYAYTNEGVDFGGKKKGSCHLSSSAHLVPSLAIHNANSHSRQCLLRVCLLTSDPGRPATISKPSAHLFMSFFIRPARSCTCSGFRLCDGARGGSRPHKGPLPKIQQNPLPFIWESKRTRVGIEKLVVLFRAEQNSERYHWRIDLVLGVHENGDRTSSAFQLFLPLSDSFWQRSPRGNTPINSIITRRF